MFQIRSLVYTPPGGCLAPFPCLVAGDWQGPGCENLSVYHSALNCVTSHFSPAPATTSSKAARDLAIPDLLRVLNGNSTWNVLSYERPIFLPHFLPPTLGWSQDERMRIKELLIPKTSREKIRAVLRSVWRIILALCTVITPIQRTNVGVTRKSTERHPPLAYCLLKTQQPTEGRSLLTWPISN